MAKYVQRESVSISELLRLLADAQCELVALCNGKRFRMSVPVQNDDSDMVIGDALRHAHAFVAAYQSLAGGVQHEASTVEAPERALRYPVDHSTDDLPRA